MGSQQSRQLTRRLFSAIHYLLLVGGALALLALVTVTAPLATAAALLAGWVAGSLAEYSVHRFVLHGSKLTAGVHARHHAAPAQEQIDPLSYFGPIAVALFAWLALRELGAGAVAANGITAGLCLQYSWFRAVHRRMHRPGHPLASGKKAHFHRGHHADTGCNFGVTTPFWDRCFGSQAPRTMIATGES